MPIGELEGTLTRQYQIADLVEALSQLPSASTLEEAQDCLDAFGHTAHRGLAQRLFHFTPDGHLVENELLRSCRGRRSDAPQLVWASLLIADHRLAEIVETSLTDDEGRLDREAFNSSRLRDLLADRGIGSPMKAASNLLRYFEAADLVHPIRSGPSIVGVASIRTASHAVPGLVRLTQERLADLEDLHVPDHEAIEAAIEHGVHRWLLMSPNDFFAAAIAFDQETSTYGVKEETIEAEDDYEDSDIVEPFDPERIDIITRNPSVALLLSRLTTSRLDLDPEFQRKAGIWNVRRKSRLIESLLLKIPLPTLYAAESQDGEDRWIVVDGIQRLSTIASFVSPGSVPGSDFVKLSDLEYLRQYEGFTFSDLSPRLQTRLSETEFVLNLIRRGTPEPVMFNIFARINTGGAPLTRQELRHALVPGEGRKLLRRLAETDEFINATGGRVSDDRMQAREMILRFIAFYEHGPESYGPHTDFDSFLTQALKELSATTASERNRIELAFKQSLVAATSLFGGHAFRKSLPGDRRRAPINKALFETVLVALASLDPASFDTVSLRADAIISRFRVLLADPEFIASISQGTGDLRKVRLRHAYIREAVSA